MSPKELKIIWSVIDRDDDKTVTARRRRGKYVGPKSDEAKAVSTPSTRVEARL